MWSIRVVVVVLFFLIVVSLLVVANNILFSCGHMRFLKATVEFVFVCVGEGGWLVWFAKSFSCQT